MLSSRFPLSTSLSYRINKKEELSEKTNNLRTNYNRDHVLVAIF